MSCGRGEGKDTTWSVYRKLLLKEYYYQRQMEEERRRRALEWKRFRLAVKAHSKIWSDLPADLLRLKKPILPHRWINFREGWCSAAWGFTNADLTPYALEEAAAKLVEQFRDPNYKEVLGTLRMPDGFTLGEEDN